MNQCNRRYYFQRKILSLRAVDGILTTLMAMKRGENAERKIPFLFNSYYIRAAHTYKMVYREVFEAFFAAGLSELVSVSGFRTFFDLSLKLMALSLCVR